MKHISITVLAGALAAALSFSSLVQANDDRRGHYNYDAKWQTHDSERRHFNKHDKKRFAKQTPAYQHSRDNQFWAKAPVTNISPVYEQIKAYRDEKSCGYYDVKQQPARHRHNDSITDELIGGVIGGAIGNAVGANDTNKKIQAVIGAAIGASIAHDLNQRKEGRYDGRVTQEYRCETHQVPFYRDELSGYDVTYQYQGREYRTFLTEHPGKHVRVRLELAEVYP